MTPATFLVITIAITVVAATVGAWLLMPPRSYLPSGNQNLMFAFVLTPPGYSMGEYRRMGEHIESVIRPWWEVGPEEGDGEAVLAQTLSALDAASGVQSTRSGIPDDTDVAEAMRLANPPKGRLSRGLAGT